MDFYCHAVSLVVEVDGSIHRKQEEYDRARDAQLTELGLKVLRFDHSDVTKNLDVILDVILRACQAGEEK